MERRTRDASALMVLVAIPVGDRRSHHDQLTPIQETSRLELGKGQLRRLRGRHRRIVVHLGHPYGNAIALARRVRFGVDPWHPVRKREMRGKPRHLTLA